MDIIAKVKELPTTSGVYIMKNSSNVVIYVGKAKNLKNRVSQYFLHKQNQNNKTISMVSNVFDFDYILTNSELDALVLECNLIKKYQPHYNILLKDGKNYPYIRINLNEDFPKFEIIRRLKKDKYKYYGPYFAGISVNEILKAINYAYPIKMCNKKFKATTLIKPCLYYSLGLCCAPCANKINKVEYRKIIDEACDFLNGKDKKLIEIIKQKMDSAVSTQNFELALELRDLYYMLNKLSNKTVTALSKTEDIDIFGIASNEQLTAISVLIIRAGKMIGAKSYNLPSGLTTNLSLSSFITQYYTQNILYPKIILLPFVLDDEGILQEYFIKNSTHKVEIAVPTKGTKKQLITQAYNNAEECLKKNIELAVREVNKTTGAVELLQKYLGLKNLPSRIEAYDISNISGTNSVCSMVVFLNGKKASAHYRRFKIKTVKGPNDFLSLNEAIGRRLQKLSTTDISFGSIPSLILIDGGKGQNSSCRDMIKSYNQNIDVISLAKKEEEVFVEDQLTPMVLDKNSYALKLLQAVRDEAHRFAITFHRHLRQSKQQQSVLDDIKGLGKVKKQALIDKFKSVTKIKQSTAEEISKIKGINLKFATEILNFLNK